MSSEQAKIVSTFMDLVRVPSPTFHEEEMSKELNKRLTEMGLTPKVDRLGNVMVRVPGDETKEVFMLNAHMDTVQKVGEHIKPEIEEGWIRSDGKTILGADNKTAVAAILVLLQKLQNEKTKKNNPLEVVFTVSEESGNRGAHGLDYSSLSAKKGYIFDASDREFGSMVISSPAYLRFDLKIQGRDSHASRPEDAINTLPVFAKAFLDSPNGRIDEKTTVNFGIVSAGSEGGPVNTVPGFMVVSGEVRSMEDTRLKEVSDQIIQNFKKEAKNAGAKVESKVVVENGSFEFSPEDDFIKRTQKVLGEMGIEPQLVRSWGCYEANIFAEHGIMMLNLADGSLDTHTKDERIKVSDLERLEELVYKLVI